MALVFGDSFDHYLTADILKKWTSQSAVATSAIGQASALPPHATGLLIAGNVGHFEKTLPAALTTFIAGTWFKTDSLANASIILSFIDGATLQVEVRYTTAGNITFTRNATVLATSVNTIAIDTWYHIEVKALISDTVGTYEVRVNGTATNWIAAATGADTKNTANASISGVRINSRNANDNTANHRFQDYYILDTTGTVAVDFLGPCRFQVIRPNGAGNSAQWTGNYADNFANVQDSQGDSDSTFNQSSTAAQIDLFAMDDVPSGTIHAIQHVLMAKQDAGAARTIRPKTRISAANYNGTSVATTASYVFVREAVSVSPATAVAWTAAEVSAAEFGYELVS